MIVNYKIFKPNKINNCQSCDQLANKSNVNQINNNMKEIINMTKTSLDIVNYNNFTQNKLFNNKIPIEYYGNKINER